MRLKELFSRVIVQISELKSVYRLKNRVFLSAYSDFCRIISPNGIKFLRFPRQTPLYKPNSSISPIFRLFSSHNTENPVETVPTPPLPQIPFRKTKSQYKEICTPEPLPVHFSPTPAFPHPPGPKVWSKASFPPSNPPSLPPFPSHPALSKAAPCLLPPNTAISPTWSLPETGKTATNSGFGWLREV